MLFVCSLVSWSSGDSLDSSIVGGFAALLQNKSDFTAGFRPKFIWLSRVFVVRIMQEDLENLHINWIIGRCFVLSACYCVQNYCGMNG